MSVQALDHDVSDTHDLAATNIIDTRDSQILAQVFRGNHQSGRTLPVASVLLDGRPAALSLVRNEHGNFVGTRVSRPDNYL